MNASSESGLWAMLISRVLTAVKLDTFFLRERSGWQKSVRSQCSKLVPGFRMIWFRCPVLRVIQALPHANVCRQNGPHHSPGGGSHDQKPPDHPHDDLGYQKGRGFTSAAVGGSPRRSELCGASSFAPF